MSYWLFLRLMIQLCLNFTYITTTWRVDVRWESSSHSSSFYLCATAKSHHNRRQQSWQHISRSSKAAIFLPLCHHPVCLRSVVACMWESAVQGGSPFCREAVQQLKESLLVLGDAERYLQLCRPCTLKWAWANNSAGRGSEGIGKHGACNKCATNVYDYSYSKVNQTR